MHCKLTVFGSIFPSKGENMRIIKNDNLEVFIFNVERGLSLLIKAPNNFCFLYDVGSTSGFSPIETFIKKNCLIHLRNIMNLVV